MTLDSRHVARRVAALALPLVGAVLLGVAANLVDDIDVAAWLVMAIPTVTVVLGTLILTRAKLALLHGALGAVVAFLAGLSPAEGANDSVYEPLLNDVGLAFVWAALGFLPVPLIALVAWVWRSRSAAEVET